jgi:hypothetical protein
VERRGELALHPFEDRGDLGEIGAGDDDRTRPEHLVLQRRVGAEVRAADREDMRPPAGGSAIRARTDQRGAMGG